MNSVERNPPVGEMKKMVSLVDRSDFDEYVYPPAHKETHFQPVHTPYFQLATEIATMPFTGSPEWGKRITFSVPWPWPADFLQWIAFRLKPLPWFTKDIQQHLMPGEIGDYRLLNDDPYRDYDDFFVWANSLGTTAIALAEMEVDGVIVEQFSGDWIDVWNRTLHSVTEATPWDDALLARRSRYTQPTLNALQPTEDNFIYCYLPFWFSRWVNTALPLCSIRGPDTVRFHITLRPFSEVVRRIKTPMKCSDTPLGRKYAFQNMVTHMFGTFTANTAQPLFESADIIAGIAHVDTPLRDRYIKEPTEILMSPVQEIEFAEPLKYVKNRADSAQTIEVQLPINANGPIRQIYFFLRRKQAIEQYNDRQNYSATINPDPVWNPEKPLLLRASLQVGTAIWADEEEAWWRTNGNAPLPGGVRGWGDFIYVYNFAEKPAEFGPSGSVNASRVDLRLNLTVAPPDDEWTVSVFLVGTNWMRFQNSIANLVFMD